MSIKVDAPITNPIDYKIYLKDRAVKDFLARVIPHIVKNHKYYLGRNIDILLEELESIDNASFESGIDEQPF